MQGKAVYERNFGDYSNRKLVKYEPKIKVTCTACKTMSNEDDVEFIDISEDMQGYDVLTFRCPHCKEVSKSHRR